MVEHHKDVKVKVAAKIIIVHYPYQAFWREASPFDFENATAKDNEPVDEEVDEDISEHFCPKIAKALWWGLWRHQ